MLDESGIIRYSRQLILKEIGSEGQEKLGKANVLVIGAGGLGSPVLYYLAAAGVGKIGTADFDTVGLSNLQRQIMFSTEDLQRKKVDVVKEKLEKLNPDVRVEKYSVKLDAGNIGEIVDGYDVIVDAVDNFAARYLISDCCYFKGKPLVEGAVLGFTGILTTIIPGKTPCYRCLYPKPQKDVAGPASSNTGVIGMTAGTIGSLQALETLKVILGIGEILSGRMLAFDGLDMSFREIMLDRNPKCQLCGENPSIRELTPDVNIK